MKTKICSKCGIKKKSSEFYKDKRAKDGYCSSCKMCKKRYAQENKEKIKKYQKQWKKEHKEYHKEQMAKWYKENKKNVLKRQKKYYEEYAEEIKEKVKEYQENNKEKIYKQKKKYEKENNNKIRKYRKNKYHTDINFKFSCNLRARLLLALKGKSKSASTLKLLGCSIKNLKEYLEKQFKSGMTWDNYGKDGWEIDHIKPCAKFDLTKPEEQRKCFNYKNLQPLWWRENRLKKDKYNVTISKI